MTTTIADHLDDFLNDMQHIARLRPHTVRAYRTSLLRRRSNSLHPSI